MLEKQAHICSLLVSRASPRKGEEESLCRAGCLLGFFFVGQFQIFVGAFICSKLNEVFFFSVPWQTLWPTNINIRCHHFLNVKQNAADRFS